MDLLVYLKVKMLSVTDAEKFVSEFSEKITGKISEKE